MQQEPARELSIAAATARAGRLSFERISNQTRLFLDYQSEPRSLEKYYPNAVTEVDELTAFSVEVLRKYPPHRAEICDALNELNISIGASQPTMKNLERLRSSSTVAVVTGQQAGLFTGPLYTIYKALTAVKLAERLTAGGVEAVPVFWAATEDHDFAEVANAWVLGNSDELVKLEYKPANQPESSPVGMIQLEEGITGVVDEMFATLPKTEFSTELHHRLSNVWSPGGSFGTAFLKTLASVLAHFGIIFIDPVHPAIKKLCAPIYLEAFRKRDAIVNQILGRSAELENSGYHAQVAVGEDYVPLFWQTDDGRRISLRKSGEGTFQAASVRTDFSAEQIAASISSEPERFSPGVMLRPVVQDWLLPTICYLGGAAEVAYFAQNSVAYETLDRPVTPILHRQSFTVVEARHARTLKKYDLELADLFAGLESTLLRLAEQTLAPETAATFADAADRIGVQLNRLNGVVSEIDSTLADNLAKRRRKIMYHLAAIQRKSLLAKARGDETLHRRVRALFANLMPNGALQERSVNLFTYLNKFGPQFVHWVYAAIDLDDREHRIINL